MSRITTIDGLPVLDAKRPLVLHVTKSDITKAHTKAPNACAVARACARELHVKEARVHLSRVDLRTNDHNWTRYITPRPMRAEIIAFDRGGAFEPSEFTLHPVNAASATGRTQGGKTRGKRHPPARRRRAPHIVANVRGGPADG